MTGSPPLPDLSDPGQRADYRRELRGIARKTRYAGIALACVGALLALASKRAEDPAMWRLGAILALAAGGGLMIFGMARRAMYHALRTTPPRPADPD
ncbi:hypothetical protein [Sphingomonas colocasiae]|uniref:DUF202 domain-containing protein n=1 Tax=Sphingomonas colocasiae TaxID=1848973 RepID=A0ABS7PN72_9SPHN|nr:hypothetical protein [Sphingomonas colocasiae]MBY8822718.1 hypothetical protein [Sphingomonas colocasiae]